MSTQELKREIEKIIDNFPDAVLEEVLQYLQEVKELSDEKMERAKKINQILREDRTLLKKLAE